MLSARHAVDGAQSAPYVTAPECGLEEFPLRNRRKATSVLIARAVLRQRRHVNGCAVAFVRSESIVRKAQMNIEHVRIARSFGENRCGADLLDICIGTRLRDEADVA